MAFREGDSRLGNEVRAQRTRKRTATELSNKRPVIPANFYTPLVDAALLRAAHLSNNSGGGVVASDFWELDDTTVPESMKALYPANMDGDEFLFFGLQRNSIRRRSTNALEEGIEITLGEADRLEIKTGDDSIPRIQFNRDEMTLYNRIGNFIFPNMIISSQFIEGPLAIFFGPNGQTSREKIDYNIGDGGGKRLDYYATQQHKFWTGSDDSTAKLLMRIGTDDNPLDIEINADAGRFDIDTEAFFNESVVLGGESADLIAFNGRISSDILPSTNEAWSLGNSINRWDNLHSVVVNTDTFLSRNAAFLQGYVEIGDGSNTSSITIKNDLLPDTTRHEIGSSSNRFGDIYAASIDLVSGMEVKGRVYLKDDVDLGESNGDDIRFNGEIVGDVGFNSNEASDIGTSTKKAGTIYAKDIEISDNSTFDKSVEIDGSLYADGSLFHRGDYVGFFGVLPVTRPQMVRYSSNYPSISAISEAIRQIVDGLHDLGLCNKQSS
ncbi:MAG: hypothetical protein K8823_1524 [Cenarchaeum symbiont of Oopsacas minuta]|nr:hypothetical protein [Cenarchaeum symbiont of Oopsacas minuta]